MILAQFNPAENLEKNKELEGKNNRRKKEEVYYCKITNKKFNSKKTYENYLKSKKYLKNLKKWEAKQRANKDKQVEEMTENTTEKEAATLLTTLNDITVCLFSNKKSDTFEENLEHMRKEYGFFIIEEESCIDKKGLIRYLAELVHKHHECIFCGKSKGS